MAENKKSFVLYSDLIHTVSKMPSDKAGDLFKHILAYVNDQNPTTEDLIVQLTFEPIKQQLKRDLVNWEVRAERSRLNGLKGGRPPKTENLQEPEKTQQVILEPRKPDNDTVTVTVNVNDNVTVNDILLKKETKGIFKVPTVFEIQEYCLERKNTVDSETFFNFYESKGWMVGKAKMKDWKASVRTWEKSKNNNNESTNNNSGRTNTNNSYVVAKANPDKIIRELAEDFANGNIPGVY